MSVTNRHACLSVVLAVGIMATWSTSAGADAGHRLWRTAFHSPGVDDAAVAVAVSPDGQRVYTTGQSDSRYLTVAYDAATGAQLWARFFVGPGSYDLPTAMALGPDGNAVYVTGWSFAANGGEQDAVTVAYEAATGRKLWVKRYRGTFQRGATPSAIAVSPTGGQIFVAGATWDPGGFTDALTLTYLSTGQLSQSSTTLGPAQWNAAAVSVDGSKLVLAGNTGTGITLDYLVSARDVSVGTTLWNSTYDGPATGYDSAAAVAASANAVFVTGQTDQAGGYFDYGTVAFDAETGSQMWDRIYDGPDHDDDFVRELALDPAGSSVLVTGQSQSGANPNYDWLTEAIDPGTGAELWTSRLQGPGPGEDIAYGVAFAPDGSTAYVCGHVEYGYPAELDFETAGLDSTTGSVLWTQREVNLSGDSARAVTVSPDGARVFAAGSMFDGSGTDFLTVGYRP